jgi:hypothetical protein
LTTEFLLEALRLPDTFTQQNAGIQQPLKPTVRRLSKNRFSRVHPGSEYRCSVLLVTDQEGDRESYLAIPALAPLLGSMAAPKILRLAVDNASTPYLVPEPIPDPNGRPNLWNLTNLQAIKTAENFWVRLESCKDAGQYRVIIASGNLGDPRWPSQTMDELVLQCFEGRIIQTADHPLIRQLEGRA